MAPVLGRTTDNDQVGAPGTGRKDNLDKGFAHVHLIFDSEMRKLPACNNLLQLPPRLLHNLFEIVVGSHRMRDHFIEMVWLHHMHQPERSWQQCMTGEGLCDETPPRRYASLHPGIEEIF